MNNLDEFIRKAELGELSDDDLEQVSGGLTSDGTYSNLVDFGKHINELVGQYLAEGKSPDEITELVKEAIDNFRAETANKVLGSNDIV